MQQELSDQATTARQQQQQQTLQQTLTTAQYTNELAQQLRANQQIGPVEIQGTFHQAGDPKFPTFRSKYMTIAEWLQELQELAALHNLTEPNKVVYAKLAMPSQKGHLHNVKPTTTWAEFKQLVTDKFERRHAQHDLLRAIQDLRMHGHDLQRYVNEFMRLKALITANAQSDIQMMYTVVFLYNTIIHTIRLYYKMRV